MGDNISIKTHILIAQNSDINRMMLCSYLTQAGYVVTEIRYASEILLQLQTTPASVLLLDINFPEITQYSPPVFKCSKLKNISVLLLCNRESYQQSHLNQEADDYIAQPTNRAELLTKIKCYSQISELKQRLQEKDTRLEALLRHTSTAIAYTDMHLTILKTNEPFSLHYGNQEHTQKIFHIAQSPHDQLQLKKQCFTHLFHKGHFECEIKTKQQNGQLNWVNLRGQKIIKQTSEHEIVWTLEPINTSKSRKKQQDLNASVFESLGAAMIIINSHEQIIHSNHAMQVLFEYDENELNHYPATELFDSSQNKDTIHTLLNQTIEQQQWQGELWLRKKSHLQFPTQVLINRINTANDSDYHFVALITDISQNKAKEQALKYRANHDSLTGLPNRDKFFERLNSTIATASRNKYSIAVLYLDLDGFKTVNDTLGHGKGDEILINVANKLQFNLREIDIVARLGGDEFALILNGTSQDLVTATAERLIKAVSSRITETIYISASIGIAVYPYDTSDPNKLLHYADEAMYKAKSQGKHSFHWHNTKTFPQNN